MPLINVGEKAPGFTVSDQSGQSHRLEDYRGRAVVLYFYPKDDTEDCTTEACAFNDGLKAMGKLNAVVLGMNAQDQKSHAKFAAKHAIEFPLLADEPGANGTPVACDAYGVWIEKSMYGKKYMGIARTTYVINGDGRVAARWDKVKVEGHAEEVMAFLKGEGASTAPAKAAKPAAAPKRRPIAPVKKNSTATSSKPTPTKKGVKKKSSAKAK
jgi:thioredoxin-dependent peroxiredoxin